MLDLHFYQYNGQNNTVNKVLGDNVILQGVLREPCNIMNPVITLRYNNPFPYNYVYIPILSRFYFVDNITVLSGDKCEIRLSIDVLKTYEQQILTATATVTESDNPNPYISNRNSVFNRKPKFEKIGFENTGLLNSDGSIIMVTIKGNE